MATLPSSAPARLSDESLQQQQHALQSLQRNDMHPSSLEIAYSTISPKVETQPATNSPYPMMSIKLGLIDQNPRTPGGDSSCDSPFPMTPLTPGGSTDLSKKQRHNLREQRRILRISNQFDILRGKLENAGYSSSKKDKYSVLQATLEYISQLERNQVGRNDGQQSLSSSGGPGQAAAAANAQRLSITIPDKQHQPHPFMIDSMPSPVPPLSIPNLPSFPINPIEHSMYAPPATPNSSSFTVDCIEGSSAIYRDAFANSSMPALITKLDGTIVDANHLFLNMCFNNLDELRLHTLYTMVTAMDVPKMYNLVNTILACEMLTAQGKMMWHFANSSDERKVFVSLTMIYDSMHRPANLYCSLLPLSQ